MAFVHWWALGLGVAALAAPVAVHLLTKPKPVAFPLSTVGFLQEIIEQRKARSRLRDWLILLLRALCIALLALGLARPLLKQPPSVPLAASRDAFRVIVLDASQSMSAGTGGVTGWSQAQAAALQYLDAGSGVHANVVFSAAQPHSVFDSLSRNLPGLRDAIQRMQSRAERADPRSALELAGRLLSDVESGSKELVVISDFQRSNWGALHLDVLPAEVKIQFHSIALSDVGNVAVQAVQFASEPVVGQPAVLEVEIANFSDREVDVRCRIDLSGAQRTLEGKLAPQSTQTLTKTWEFDEPGWKYGWAKLESNLDALPADDERPIAVRIRPAPRVVLVTRQNPQEVPSSTFYLEQALNVALKIGRTEAATDPSEKIARVNPLKSAVRTWPESDVLIVDHPGAVSQETLQGIASQLRRGKGVLYVASEFVDAVNLEQLAELLGGDFQPPVSLHSDASLSDRKELFVQRIEARQAPFNVLAGAADAPLQGVRFNGGLATRATGEGLREQVLAELSDTSALLYLSSVGAGQLAILNTDLGRTNWPVHPTFLPVLSELAKTLLAGRGQNAEAACGEPLVRMLPTAVSETKTWAPETVAGVPPADNAYGEWSWSASQGSVVWSWPSPAGAGIYALKDESEVAWMVATSAPALEADLQSLDESVLTERITEKRTVGYSSSKSQEEQSDSLWSWLIVACLFGLIVEITVLRISRM